MVGVWVGWLMDSRDVSWWRISYEESGFGLSCGVSLRRRGWCSLSSLKDWCWYIARGGGLRLQGLMFIMLLYLTCVVWWAGPFCGVGSDCNSPGKQLSEDRGAEAFSSGLGLLSVCSGMCVTWRRWTVTGAAALSHCAVPANSHRTCATRGTFRSGEHSRGFACESHWKMGLKEGTLTCLYLLRKPTPCHLVTRSR